MAKIDDLISRIEDPQLRLQLTQEVAKMQKQRKFGLVYEEHEPECTPLFEVPVSRGATVALKSGKLSEQYVVARIADGIAYCERRDESHAITPLAIDDLVVVAQFGEPIFPFLHPIDSVCNAPESDLWHTLIQADNYHALQLLVYLYSGQVDCIYIDPPYNSGAKDWKYNNKYVDDNDVYRHSNWLSMMEKRLALSKKLLNPKDSVLIVAIDDKEYYRLGCLLEQIFPSAKITMISSVINPAGKAKKGGVDFSRTDEYLFFIQIGDSKVNPEIREVKKMPIQWEALRRHSLANGRGKHGVGACGPNQFYPFYINPTTNEIVEIGEPIPEDMDRFSVKQLDGCVTVFPVRDNGVEMNWGCVRETALQMYNKGYLRVGQYFPDKPQQYNIVYLTKGNINAIENGEVVVTESDEKGILQGYYPKGKPKVPTTNWNKPTHNATSHGTDLIGKFLLNNDFDYPKSLYAVADCLRLFVANNPDALILDFFAGSGTTLNAVNLLNLEDGGRRRCLLVTNNEVGNTVEKELIKEGHRPGDNIWESKGIARLVTWPRTKCSILGKDIHGDDVKGEYLLTLSNSTKKVRKVVQLPVNSPHTKADKKSLLRIICNLDCPSPSEWYDEIPFVIDDEHSMALCYHPNTINEMVEELRNNHLVETIYICCSEKKTFNDAKKIIMDEVGYYYSNKNITCSMSDGFKTNAAFFKLGFLNQTSVKVGREFAKMLPMLWLKAGAHGVCPNMEGDCEPDMMVLPENRMAILCHESHFEEFAEQVNGKEIETVYIVTDSEPAYKQMVCRIHAERTFQLYRDYLDNFRINQQR